MRYFRVYCFCVIPVQLWIDYKMCVKMNKTLKCAVFLATFLTLINADVEPKEQEELKPTEVSLT